MEDATATDTRTALINRLTSRRRRVSLTRTADLLETLQRLSNFVKIGQISGVFEDFRILHLALLIDHKRRPLGHAFPSAKTFVLRAVGLDDFAIKIAQERKIQILSLFP